MNPHRWVSCGEEDDKRRWQINVLVAKSDEDTSSSPSDLSVQYRVQDGVVTFYILKVEKRKKKEKEINYH